jgi:hypothetical protein
MFFATEPRDARDVFFDVEHLNFSETLSKNAPSQESLLSYHYQVCRGLVGVKWNAEVIRGAVACDVAWGGVYGEGMAEKWE